MEPDTETEDYVLTKSKKVTKIETAQKNQQSNANQKHQNKLSNLDRWHQSACKTSLNKIEKRNY